MAFFLFVLASVAATAGLLIGRRGPTDIQLGIAATCLVGAVVLFGLGVLLVKVNALRADLDRGRQPDEPRRKPSLTD